jgi:hypothetical protein
MVWMGISLDVATELVVLDRHNLNANRHITNILEPVMLYHLPHSCVGQRNIKHIFFSGFRLLHMSKSRPKVRWIYRLVLDLQEFR